MKKNTKSYFIDILLYTAVVLFSNLISSNISMALTKIAFEPLFHHISIIVLAVLVFATEIVVNIIIPIVSVFVLFRAIVPRRYYPSENNRGWIKECLLIIMPGEVFRFLICLHTLGHLKSTGYYSLIPTILFEQTYVRWFERHDQTRELLQFSIGDYTAYTICYLPYITLFLFLVIKIYKHFWMQGKRDCEDLVVYDRNHRLY